MSCNTPVMKVECLEAVKVLERYVEVAMQRRRILERVM